MYQGKDLYVLCFIQPFSEYLFLTHAGGGEQPQQPATLCLGAVIQFFSQCTSKPVPPSEK